VSIHKFNFDNFQAWLFAQADGSYSLAQKVHASERAAHEVHLGLVLKKMSIDDIFEKGIFHLHGALRLLRLDRTLDEFSTAEEIQRHERLLHKEEKQRKRLRELIELIELFPQKYSELESYRERVERSVSGRRSGNRYLSSTDADLATNEAILVCLRLIAREKLPLSGSLLPSFQKYASARANSRLRVSPIFVEPHPQTSGSGKRKDSFAKTLGRWDSEYDQTVDFTEKQVIEKSERSAAQQSRFLVELVRQAPKVCSVQCVEIMDVLYRELGVVSLVQMVKRMENYAFRKDLEIQRRLRSLEPEKGTLSAYHKRATRLRGYFRQHWIATQDFIAAT